MWVVLTQQKNGVSAASWRRMKSLAAATNSSSQVSMRFLVSGPVSSIFCLPTRPQRGSLGRVVLVGGPAVQHAARAELLAELREVLRGRVVRQLRLLFGVQVVEVAEELVEAVHRRQILVAVAQVVLAELPGRVAQRLEQLRDRRVLRLQAESAPGHADFGEAGAVTRSAR